MAIVAEGTGDEFICSPTEEHEGVAAERQAARRCARHGHCRRHALSDSAFSLWDDQASAPVHEPATRGADDILRSWSVRRERKVREAIPNGDQAYADAVATYLAFACQQSCS